MTKEIKSTKPVDPKAPVVVKEDKPAKSADDFTVADPEVLRPKELPLVITPGKDGWKNTAQESYANTLNAYAYKNPDKWHEKKAVLLAQLTEIGKNPRAITKYQGNDNGNLSYKNKIIQD